jgi:cell division GTPase FtsZ
MQSFTHLFVGIGNAGARIVNNIHADGTVRVTVNPAYLLMPRARVYESKLREFFSHLPKNTFLWLIFEDKEVNHFVREIILESVPSDTINIAYVLTPRRELVMEEKPPWADEFETVFYDSLWDFFHGDDEPLKAAFYSASKSIADMFSRLHYYLETQMLVNIDYADLFNMIKGGNVGIIRLLRKVDFDWHWGIWERGLIGILVGKEFPLMNAHRILKNFQEILSEKDVIWGVVIDESLDREVEILALLVKKW